MMKNLILITLKMNKSPSKWQWREAIAMVDRFAHTSGISNDDQSALSGIKENFERIVIT